MSMEM
jgi:hypothetical protein